MTQGFAVLPNRVFLSLRHNIIASLLLALVLQMSSAAAAGTDVSTDFPWQLELVNKDSDRFNLSDYAGKIWVLSFFYTRCGDSCPIQSVRLAQAQALLSPAALKYSRFVSVSIDQKNDTPEAIRHYLHHFKLNEQHWHFGTPPGTDSLHALMQQAGVKILSIPSADNPDHTMKILLIDPAGSVMQRYPGHKISVNRLAQAVETLTRLRFQN